MMNTVNFYGVAFFLIYVILVALITLRNRSSASVNEYAIGNWNVGFWGTLASIVSGFRDGAGIAVWVTLAYFFGFGALWLTVGTIAGALLMFWATNRIKGKSETDSFITVGDLVKSKSGKNTAKLCSFIIALSAILYSASQLFVSGSIMSVVTGAPMWVGMLLIALIVGIYLAVGGYNSVIKTDILQWGIIITIIVLPFLIKGSTVEIIDFTSFVALPLNYKVGFVGISMLFFFTSADIWQRLFSARNKSVAKNAFALVIPIYLLISLGLIWLGYSIKSVLPDSEAGTAFFDIFGANIAHPIVLSLLGIFATASIMSTLDTQTFLFSTTVSKDILPKTETEQGYRTRSVIITFVLLVILFVVALSIKDIVEFLFGAVTSVTVMAPLLFISTILGHTFRKKYDTAIMLSILVGLGSYFYLFLKGYFDTHPESLIIPASVSLLLLLPIYLHDKFTKNDDSVTT